MRHILITGGCGFVGSSLALALKSKYPMDKVISMDNLKRRGSELNISRLKEAGIDFVHGDIRNASDFDVLSAVDCVIDAAAEPSVLAGLNGGLEYLIDTNLLGTINTLAFARKYKADFIFLSTSRVYPIAHLENAKFSESDTRFRISDDQVIPGLSSNGVSEIFPLNGSRSFYGATKLASELFVQEFASSYGLKAVINRCGVISGPWQMGKVDQGVIVLWMAAHFWKKQLQYIGFSGSGKQVRDVLDVNDLFALIDWQMQNMDAVNAQVLNAGGGLSNSVSLLELTALCERISGNKITIDSVKETRSADIPFYITDNTLVKRVCNWSPQISTEQCLKSIYEWIHANEAHLKPILNG